MRERDNEEQPTLFGAECGAGSSHQESYSDRRRVHELPPKAYFFERFQWCPEEGVLRWRGGAPVAPDWATPPRGFRRLRFRYRGQRVCVVQHHVAWLLFTGEWPTGIVDHVNGDCGDNRASNLRHVPFAEVDGENARRAGASRRARRAVYEASLSAVFGRFHEATAEREEGEQ